MVSAAQTTQCARLCRRYPARSEAHSSRSCLGFRAVRVLYTARSRSTRARSCLRRVTRTAPLGARSVSQKRTAQMAWVWDDASAEHSGHTVLSLVIARCCDRAPMVRVRSLAALTSVLNSTKAETAHPPLRAAVHELVASGGRCSACQPTRTGQRKVYGTGGGETSTSVLLGMISQRVNDDKAAVRRAAVQVRAIPTGCRHGPRSV